MAQNEKKHLFSNSNKFFLQSNQPDKPQSAKIDSPYCTVVTYPSAAPKSEALYAYQSRAVSNPQWFL
jgi:hypothetical protein